jgi:hypothetical protein
MYLYFDWNPRDGSLNGMAQVIVHRLRNGVQVSEPWGQIRQAEVEKYVAMLNASRDLRSPKQVSRDRERLDAQRWAAAVQLDMFERN